MTGDDDDRIRVGEIPEPLLEQVINSRGFQKMLAYRKLADGIEVLEDRDQLFASMVTSITKQHSSNIAESTTEEFFDLFVKEVQDYTEGIVDDEPLVEGKSVLDDMIVQEGRDE